ncbi:MAG: hypothetical protein Q8L93_03235 [Rhodocyclaceae bacterium]|nr:hypothetical protein [Rhodocyclaceae bacterium]
MGRIISNAATAGRVTQQLAMPGANIEHAISRFAKAGRHPSHQAN